jgi:hypothetical protein
MKWRRTLISVEVVSMRSSERKRGSGVRTSQKAKELKRKEKKVLRRRRKEDIPADGGKSWHPHQC